MKGSFTMSKQHFRGPERYECLKELDTIAMTMRRNGVCVDLTKLQEHRSKLTSRNKEIQDLLPDILLGSSGKTHNARDWFFKKKGIKPLGYTETGSPIFDGEVLTTLSKHEDTDISKTAKLVLEFTQNATLLSRYINGLPLTGNKIFPTWKVWGTITGRWASSDPNFQNWPGEMLDMIIPRKEENHIVGADYSQLELRIVAILSEDIKLLNYYKNNDDVHTITAKEVLFGLSNTQWAALTKAQQKQFRNVAKTMEYAFNYNASEDVTTVWKTVVIDLPTVTIEQVKFMRKRWFQAHPWITRWQDSVLKKANEEYYTEEILSGRREYFHNKIVEPNKALNFPVQGFGGELMNRAIKKIAKELRMGEYLIAQIHDAAYLEGPDPIRLREILNKAMNQTISLENGIVSFPIEVKYGKNMKDLKEF